MTKNVSSDIKRIVAEISEEVLVSLKILSLKKRTTLGEYVKDVLHKHVSGKEKVIDTAENISSQL